MSASDMPETCVKTVPGCRFAHPGYEVPVARMSASDMRGCMRQVSPRMSLRLRSAHPGYAVSASPSPARGR
jgi:hypothetical protein